MMDETMTDPLFSAFQYGAISVRNRIVMAPMTRGRASRDHVPTAMMTEYYRQRAGAGLIISEATGISRQGLGWPYAPGIWSSEQIEGWRSVTQAVHEAGGKIMCQLWHMGRLVHPDFLDGAEPVAPSATTAPRRARTYNGPAPYTVARSLSRSEIASIVQDFEVAARNAVLSGFDGVQLHAGSGYLLEQFLRDGTNQRTDEYGGSIANRLRFMCEVLSAVCGEIGSDRVSIRFSPNVIVSGCEDSHPVSLFSSVIKAVSPLKLAFVELREASPDTPFGIVDTQPLSPIFRTIHQGTLVLNEDYDRSSATSALLDKRADAISFGRAFIANPDLVERFARNMALSVDDRELWYTQGEAGYSDYPFADVASVPEAPRT